MEVEEITIVLGNFTITGGLLCTWHDCSRITMGYTTINNKKFAKIKILEKRLFSYSTETWKIL